MLLLGCVLFLTASSKGASLPSNERIIGGSSVPIQQFPYQVAMLNKGKQECGGSIIAPNYILTAGHCTYEIDLTQLSVRVGSTYHASGGEVIKVAHVIKHEEFSFDTYMNDIAILVLERDIVYSETAQPIKLGNSDPSPGTLLDIIGWGYLEETGNPSDDLQHAQVYSISTDVCKTMYDGVYNIVETMICAGIEKGGKDACEQDSGGAITADGIQIGIVSTGTGCARPGLPGIYTSVAKLRTWIKTKTGI